MTLNLTAHSHIKTGLILGLLSFSSTLTIVTSLTLTTVDHAHALGKIVTDPGAYARFADQIKTLRGQLEEMKQLKESLNGITDINKLAGLLKNREFQQYLPQEYSKYSDSVNSLIQGNIDGLSQKYDYYSREGSSAANDYYNQELKRQKGETYQDMAVGEAVYNQASKRMDSLNALRDRLGEAKNPKEVLDLQARISVESAFLQNDINRMQGLAMIQEARGRIDKQRDVERKNKLIDEIINAAKGG